MPTATLPSRFDSPTACDDVPPAPLNVVILHDDPTACRHAMEALAAGLDGLGGEADVRVYSWRFDELHFQPGRGRALVHAANADVFVVATAARRPVPSHVIEWLEEAFERRQTAAPTVTAVYDPENDPYYFGSLCESLVRHEAENAGLHFAVPSQLATVCVR